MRINLGSHGWHRTPNWSARWNFGISEILAKVSNLANHKVILLTIRLHPSSTWATTWDRSSIWIDLIRSPLLCRPPSYWYLLDSNWYNYQNDKKTTLWCPILGNPEGTIDRIIRQRQYIKNNSGNNKYR